MQLVRAQTEDTPALTLQPAHAAALMAQPRGSAALRQQSALQLSRTVGNRQLGQMMSIQRAASGPPTLRVGSRGAAVQQLQTQLNTQGASLTADGIFGQQTAAAVRAFQQALGLAADGVAGPQTWAALRGGGAQPVPGGQPGAGAPPPALAAGLGAKLAQVKALAAQLQGGGGSPAPQIEAGENPVPTQLPPPEMQHDGWLDDIADAAGDAWDTATDVASDVGSSIADTAGDAWDAATDVASDVGNAASDAWDSVTETANEAWDSVSDTASGVWDSVTETAGDAWDSIKELTGMEGITDKITEIVSEVRETVNGIVDTIVDTARDIAEGIGSLADRILEVINDPWKVVEAIDDLLKKLKEMVTGGEEGDDAVSGSFASETTANPNICQDAPSHTHPGTGAPGRPVKLEFRFHVDPTTVQETPEVPTNYDRMYGVSATMEYKGDITMNDDSIVQVPSTDFGTTGARIGVSGKFNHADRDSDTVYVDATLKHRQSYAITKSPGREDIPMNLSNITADNWGEAALDIDTAAWQTSLGAPLRKKYWCSDLTLAHEQFHVADAEGYMRDKAAPQLESEFGERQINVPWIIDREAEITKQVKQISEEMTTRATTLRNKHMASPASEQRAYANDSPSYEARAFSIRTEAKRNGWVKDDKKK